MSVSRCVITIEVYATGRPEEEDGKALVCDKRDRVISYVFCRDFHLTLMFSGLLQKDLFKGKRSLAKGYFKQNYCHACHTRFAVFFPPSSCSVSLLIIVLSLSLILFEGRGGCRQAICC